MVDPIKDALGQTVIVENRTGARAMLAANTVAKADPDGHMLLMATSGEVAIAQYLYKEKMSYDPSRELVPIALVGIVPCVVVVAEATPVHNPKELIAYAKANAGKFSFSSSGVGNPQQLAGELMNIMAGINVLHVPYRGSAPAVTDVATGAVTMSFHQPRGGAAAAQGRQAARGGGDIEGSHAAIAGCGAAGEGAPGLAGYELLNWFGMFTTGGTPEGIVDRLNGIINTALKDPAIADKLMLQGIVPRPMTVAQYKKFVASETKKFGKIVRQANIKVSTG